MDLDKATALLRVIIKGCRFDHVAIIQASDRPDIDAEKKDPIIQYDVVVRDNLLNRDQLESLHKILDSKLSIFYKISYQIWFSEKQLLLFEWEDEPKGEPT